MRPSDFILNSDYLTIANVDNFSATVVIPAGVIPAGYGKYTYNYDISCPSAKGCFARMCVHHDKWNDSKVWGVGKTGSTKWVDNGQIFQEEMRVYTLSDNKIRFQVIITVPNQPTSTTTNVPTHTIQVKINRFKIPNIL